ncbi:hypothetical protein Tco_0285096 [Tanacetum coccineum]
MSSPSSAVTYTSMYTDFEPGRVFWGADEEIPDGGLPRVIVYGYDGLPMQPVDPPSPDYDDGTHGVPSCLLDDASPAALSPGYVPDSNPEEDPEEDSEEHADYPADGGDGDDEPFGDDSDDDTDDDDEEPFEDEEDDEEEEEHLAPADSSAIPVTRLRKARKTVRPEPPMSASMEARITEYAAAPTPPLPIWAPLGYKAAGIRMRAAAASLPLSLPSTDILEAEMPPRKRACLTTPAPGCEIGETWTSSEERSAAIEAHVRTLEAQVATLIAQTTSLQTQLTTALGRIATLEARDPEPQDGPAEAGSSS